MYTYCVPTVITVVDTRAKTASQIVCSTCCCYQGHVLVDTDDMSLLLLRIQTVFKTMEALP